MEQNNTNDHFAKKLHDEYMKLCADQWITLGYSSIADVVHTVLGPTIIMPDYFEEDMWKIKKQSLRLS